MSEEQEGVSFARRFRATNLIEYVGNQDIKETVPRYLDSNKRPQSILVYGPSGCGKTTISRIIGREYCCENRIPGVGACGKCASCLAFDDYIKTGVSEMLPDVYEIDSSESSGKKDIDSLLEGIDYPPMAGDWKIYFIDEAHALTGSAMTRLLKPLEEPPEGVLFILSTTEPDKLLDTIKNRCQLKLQVTKPKTNEIMDLLQRVCLAEDKNYDLAGLRMLSLHANNVIRDALNDLEVVLSTWGDATSKSVSAKFKMVADNLIFDFYEAYCNEDYVSYLNVLYNVKMRFEFSQFLSALTTFTVRGIYILNSVEVEGLSEDELSSYLKLFKKFSIQEISSILSGLKKMSLGDIEANLLAFIYCKNRVEEKQVQEVSSAISQESITLEDERLLRNSNLEKLESAKLSKGIKSLDIELEEVSLADMGDLFSLEKVNQ